ncbi:Asp-tRNA(Asn)/Glu-tRNA(Gln) amidotransferase subunit GatC [Candidatus Dojkabacteria bacterium]|nr:Asp-tRNA(Asn)/Glu-tRNA(Gln) amidotransferase subunit GatC [Candidatus Dojkabacteria bacterium]
MKFDKESVKKIAWLSRIQIDDDKLMDFVKDLNTILGYVQVLDEISQKDLEKLSSELEYYKQNGRFCELREDIVKQGLSKKEVFQNTKSKQDEMFRVEGSLSEAEDNS